MKFTMISIFGTEIGTVSYTHLDVYKRQVLLPAPNENNPNLKPIGERFGFVYYFQYPNLNSKINKYIVYEI